VWLDVPTDMRSAGSDRLNGAIRLAGLFAETPMRSLLVLAARPGGERLVGSCESANPVGTVAKVVVLSPRFYRGTRWSWDASSERRSDAARGIYAGLNCRQEFLGKGHDAGIRRRGSELGR